MIHPVETRYNKNDNSNTGLTLGNEQLYSYIDQASTRRLPGET